jgi:hypothetical protein
MHDARATFAAEPSPINFGSRTCAQVSELSWDRHCSNAEVRGLELPSSMLLAGNASCRQDMTKQQLINKTYRLF